MKRSRKTNNASTPTSDELSDVCTCCEIKHILEIHSTISRADIVSHFHPADAKSVGATLDQLTRDGEVELVYRLAANTTPTEPEPMTPETTGPSEPTA